MDTFFVELFKRLFSSTPWFFTVLKWIALACAAITGIPELLIENGIDLPESIDIIANKVIAIVSIIGAFVAQLTVKTETKEAQGLKD